MELSRYVVSVKDHPEKGVTLLFNVFNGKAITLPNNHFAEIEKMREDTPLWLKTKNSLAGFVKNNFLVKSKDIEEKETIKKLDAMTVGKKKLSVSLLTTTDCNMYCLYCHEGLRKKKLYLTSQIAENVANFIMRDMADQTTNELLMYFYGGEPLLNTKAIESVIRKLENHPIISSGKIRFTKDMSTNGTLLTHNMARYLSRLGINTLQVTLDGPPAVHDRRRGLSGRKGSFWKIIENIKNSMDILQITIRINLDKDNQDCMKEMIEILDAEGLCFRLNIYVDFVTNTFVNQRHCRENVMLTSDEKKKLVEIWWLFDKYQIGIPGLRFTEGMCGNLGRSSLTIDPHGDIYSCIGFVGQKQYSIANITNFHNIKNNYKKNICNPYLQCIKCKYVPVCGGGCRVQSVLESGNILGKSCNKDFLDYAYPEFLKIKFKKQHDSTAGKNGKGNRCTSSLNR
jgi:uncharacterized protein